MEGDVSSNVSKFVDKIKRLLFDPSPSLEDIHRVYTETPVSVRQMAAHDVAQLVRQRIRVDGCLSNADNFIVNLLGADAPEELFLEFMALAESATSDEEFFRMEQLSNACRGMMSEVRRASSSAWICEAFVRRAKTFKPGKIIDETDDDTLSKDSDPEGGIEKFYRAVIDEVRELSCEAKNQSQIYRNIIIDCVLSLYGEPLALLPLGLDKYSAIAAELFGFIVRFKMDPLYFLDHSSKNVTKVALGVFNFYVFTGSDAVTHISHVYSPGFIIDSMFNLSSAMILTEEPPIQQKGLLLVSSILKRAVRPKQLTWSNNVEYLKILANIMVYGQIRSLRRLSVQVFDSIISNFTDDSAYCLALNAHRLCSDSGFLGHVVSHIKTFVVKNNAKFRGKPLVDLLKTYCVTPRVLNESTDVVLSTLNLVRFLLLYRADTGVSTWLCGELETAYLNPLRETLHGTVKETQEHLAELSRAVGAVNSVSENKPEMSLVVGGQSLLALSTEEKIQMVQSSLTKFEITGSILLRIEELLIDYKERCNTNVT